MLHVKEMGRGYVEKPEDVVNVGDEIQVQVVGIDRRRGRIDLSMKELLPELEAVAAPGVQQAGVPEEPAFVVEDAFVSPFESALQEANSRRDRSEKRRERKKSRPWEFEEDDEEDIIRRTLAHHRKGRSEE